MYTNNHRCRNCRTLNTSCRPYANKTITAGEGCLSDCVKDGFICGMKPALAQVESPIQEYRTGLCPCNALQRGTYFPELIK